MRFRIRLLAPLLLTVAAGALALSTSPQQQAFNAATDAWTHGDYIAALKGYIAILNGPEADGFVAPIALQSGELYRSYELTSDGRAPRFSADGRFIAYETGLEVSRRTKVVRNDGSFAVVADLPGVSATFSPSTPHVA